MKRLWERAAMKKLLWKACHDRSRMGSSSHRFPIVTILSMSQMQLLTEREAVIQIVADTAQEPLIGIPKEEDIDLI